MYREETRPSADAQLSADRDQPIDRQAIDPPLEPQPSFGRRHLGTIVWIALCGVALVILDRLHAPRTFYYDEWSVVLERRSGGIESLLRSHNGHLSLVPAAIFRTFFELFGLNHYHPYRLAGLLVHVAVATLVYMYVRTRLGTLAALAFGSLVLLLGAGWEDILWPWQIGFMGSVGAGVAAWLALGRRSRSFDIVASIAVTVALASSGLGIPVFIGTAAWLVIDRDWRRVLRVLVAPTVLYGAWYLKYGQSQGSIDNIPRLPRYVVDEAASSLSALLGRDILWGRVVLGFLVGVVLMAAIAGWRVARCVIAPGVALLANWLLVAYSRADLSEPASSRYVYVGAVYLLLIIADALRPWRGRLLSSGAVAFAAIGIWGNWAVLHQGASSLRWSTTFTRVELRAVEWAGDTVDPAYRPNPVFMPTVLAGPYLAAVRDLGSAAATDGEVAASTNELRANTDLTSLQALRFALVPADPVLDDTSVSMSGVGGLIELPANGCATITNPADQFGSVQVMLPSDRPVIVEAGDSPVEVRLKRYADAFPEDANETIGQYETAALGVTADRAPLTQWTAELRATAAFNVCAQAD